MPELKIFDPPASYTAAEAERALPRMLMGGTPRLHAEGRTWLPPFDNDETVAPIGGRSRYETRLDNAVVEPFYERAIKRHVATVLGKQLALLDDVPQEIRGTGDGEGADSPSGPKVEGWWENIDLRGNDGNVFLRAVVEDAVGDAGYSTVLVDHPEVPPDFTLFDLEAAGMRPFWRHYKAGDVVEAVPEVINGRERLKSCRLRESGPNGEERMRVLTGAPWNRAAQEFQGWVTWQLWEKRTSKDGKEEEVAIGAGDMRPHQEIPLVPLYLNRTGFFAGSPPYLQLAYLNLRHIRQESAISESLYATLDPPFHRAGVSKEEAESQRSLGAKALLHSENPAARAEYVSNGGQAAQPAMEYQDNLEAKMERIGNEPHIRRTGNETATASAIDSAKAKTEIQVNVIAIRDFAERLLGVTAAYRGLESGGSVEIHTPPAYSERTIEQLSLLKDMASAGFIQRFRVAEALKSQGLLPDDVDAEVEAELAQQKAPPPVAPDPNGPDPLARVREAIARADGGRAGDMGGMDRQGGQAAMRGDMAGAGMSEAPPSTAAASGG